MPIYISEILEAFKLTGVVSKRVTKIIIKVIGKRIISFFYNFISNHLAHMLFFIYNFYSPSHQYRHRLLFFFSIIAELSIPASSIFFCASFLLCKKHQLKQLRCHPPHKIVFFFSAILSLHLGQYNVYQTNFSTTYPYLSHI